MRPRDKAASTSGHWGYAIEVWYVRQGELAVASR